jgi:hypothetical protein
MRRVQISGYLSHPLLELRNNLAARHRCFSSASLTRVYFARFRTCPTKSRPS